MRTALLRPVLLTLAIGLPAIAQAQTFSIQDAIRHTITTNPGVGEATANRRATEAEWRQSQGVLLPQVRLEAEIGQERRDLGLARLDPANNRDRWGHSGSVIVRQLLFDGLASLNQVWRQAARVDSAAYRVRERTELLALDAAEAYIDVVRYSRLIGLAEDNLAAHRRILGEVQARVSGGRSGEGDLQQAQERVAAAQAVLAEFRTALTSAQARYRNAVGLDPARLVFPGRLRGLPATRAAALDAALADNATLRAAGADARAARHDFESSKGNLAPSVFLEGRATRAEDNAFINGSRDDLSGKVVMSWDAFRGGIDTWRRTELGERYVEAQHRTARLQRAAVESIDKAWGARTVTGERMAALEVQIAAARRVLQSYRSEYELGQRTLIDLLDAQNQLLNAQVSLVSASGVAVFADYQLLAAIGRLLPYVASQVAVEMAPLDSALVPSTPVAQPHWLTPRPPAEEVSVMFVPPSWIEAAEMGRWSAGVVDKAPVRRLGFAAESAGTGSFDDVFAAVRPAGRSAVDAMWGESALGRQDAAFADLTVKVETAPGLD